MKVNFLKEKQILILVGYTCVLTWIFVWMFTVVHICSYHTTRSNCLLFWEMPSLRFYKSTIWVSERSLTWWYSNKHLTRATCYGKKSVLVVALECTFFSFPFCFVGNMTDYYTGIYFINFLMQVYWQPHPQNVVEVSFSFPSRLACQYLSISQNPCVAAFILLLKQTKPKTTTTKQ